MSTQHCFNNCLQRWQIQILYFYKYMHRYIHILNIYSSKCLASVEKVSKINYLKIQRKCLHCKSSFSFLLEILSLIEKNCWKNLNFNTKLFSLLDFFNAAELVEWYFNQMLFQSSAVLIKSCKLKGCISLLLLLLNIFNTMIMS